MEQERSYGLLGEALSHSYSPMIHSMLGSYEYKLFPVPKGAVDYFLAQHQFLGLNVTIPYKKTVIPYCKTLSAAAKGIGSVNTITMDQEGGLHGHNTDYYGLAFLLNHNKVCAEGKKILILGSGGASATAHAVLTDMGAGEIITISRTGVQNYQNIEAHYDARILINTTPVGMYPGNGKSPLSLDAFADLEHVIDLIYNPSKTALIMEAEDYGIPCANGLFMLVAQAKQAAELFTNTKLDDALIPQIASVVEGEMLNIVLIGMPGCGKTCTAKLLAELTGREWIDTDDYLISHAGSSIPELFAQHGENYFRDLETKTVWEISKRSKMIIATGGGVVTRCENLRYLRQNSRVIFLNREVDMLAMDGRPLSIDKDTLQEMYQKRLPLYRQAADYEINTSFFAITEVASKIKELLSTALR